MGGAGIASPGVTDNEIKIGQTMPYSGPASAYSTIGKAEAAYFRMINEQGGINGRKIALISLDDGYTPSKTVEQTRKLIEQEGVLLIFSTFGTVTNVAVQRYLNQNGVPQLFLVSGASRWNDPEHFPWTMGFPPSYQIEGRIIARYITSERAGAKVGVLYQNDEFGKDYLKGLYEGLATNAQIVMEASYDVTDPTVDSQVVSLKASGADVFVDFSKARFATLAIRRAFDIGWKPLHFLPSPSTSRSAVLEPAGLMKATAIVSPQFSKDPTDPQWKDDSAVQEWMEWMSKYYPDGDKASAYNVSGYN
jgi:branched-chain amino acid transport system substrate-binding protein